MKTIFRKKDRVKVIYGKYKGVTSSIEHVFLKKNKVIVKNVNVVKKSFKPNKANPEGGIKKIEMPIDISNIKHYIDTKTNASDISHKVNDENKKLKKIDTKMIINREGNK